MAARNLSDVGNRVEELLAELRQGDPAAAEQAEELVRLLMELYGAGLEQVMDIAGTDPAITDRLAGDPLLASLLVLHGLHPIPAEDRIRDALARVRKYTGPATLVALDDEMVAHVELDSSAASGCGALTARDAVEEAIGEAAPEVVRVEFAVSSRPVPVVIRSSPGSNAVPVTIAPAPR